jgi:uncharacterized FlaG/YvyC family protein
MIKQELTAAIEKAKRQLSIAKEQDEKDFAQRKLTKLEGELSEMEAKEQAEKDMKSNPPKKAKAKSNIHKALDQDETGTAKVISKMTSKRTKVAYDSSGKQELEDGHILMKKSDTEAILHYKGDTTKTVVFTFEGGKWIIDCCDKRGDKYPDYSKAELEDAIDYIIGELECKETVQKRKETVQKRKIYEEKQSKKSEAQKATETVEKAAESVEKKIESTDKPFPPKAADKIQDDIVKIVDSIKSAMKSRADSKDFIKGLINELQKLL